MKIRVHVERGPLAEAEHEVDAVVVDGAGRVVLSAGDPERLACLRSSAKPFQALAAVESGATQAFGFGSRELALMCASHNGEPVHVELAESMLARIGLGEGDLECGIHPPAEPSTAAALAARGEAPRTVHNNCSGKHAGMLALARHLGVDTHGYVEPDHLVQRTIRRQLEAASGVRDIPSGIDGCSAVTFYLPMIAIARLFRDLIQAHDASLATLRDAMMAHPYLVAGRDRIDTALMEALPGRAVTKVGAEALHGLGVRGADGAPYGVVVKAHDGATRAAEPAALAVLRHLGVLDDAAWSALASYAEPVRTNHRGLVVGRVRTELVP